MKFVTIFVLKINEVIKICTSFKTECVNQLWLRNKLTAQKLPAIRLSFFNKIV